MANQRIVNFGIDAPSVDNHADKTFPYHVVCREKKLLNMENLANLDKVSGKRFIFIGFPLKIRGVSGSSIRAVVLLEE